MKVALTVWEGRISPLFDAARELLVVDIEGRGMINRRHEPIRPQSPLRVVERLAEQGVTVLICGAISEVPAGMMEAAGITLIAFVAGAVEDVLSALARGSSLIPAFSMPGCGCPKCPRPRGRKRAYPDSISNGGVLLARSGITDAGQPDRNDTPNGMAKRKVVERVKGEG
jgi:predicted Fe-Mo cluster-binding NifX family protein